MKRIIMLVLLALFTITLTSCEKKVDVPEPENYLPYGLKLPKETKLEVQQVTIYLKTPEAISVTPNHLNYRQRIAMGVAITVATEYSDWKNLYIYNDDIHLFSGLADGADALDKSDHIVAKARVSRIVKGKGIEVKEYHYSGKKIVFYCVSVYSFSGYRISESELKGQRKKDYFPNWPVHTY